MAALSNKQWKSLLKSTKFFKIFEDQEIDKIINYSNLRHFPLHSYIIKENEKELSFYVLVKGHANVINKTATTGQRQLLKINTGECFGEMAVITKKPRKNYIIAGSDCYVVKINGTTIDNFEEQIQLKIYKQFSIILTERLLKSSD